MENTQFQDNSNIPPHLRPGAGFSEVVVQKPEDDRTATVVYVGDVIQSNLKTYPFYRLGGRLHTNRAIVPNNLLSRCQITQLEPAMMKVPSSLVKEDEWRNYVTSYVKSNVWNPLTNRFEDVRVGNPSAKNPIRYKKMPMAPEISAIVAAHDGTVEIAGLNSRDDIEYAQNFFFPNWMRIVSGLEVLPVRTLRELQEHINDRTATAQTQVMKQVGAALLQATNEYRAWGTKYIANQTKAVKDAEKEPGVHQGYSEIAERLFTELELTRQDNLIQSISNSINEQNRKQERNDAMLEQMAEQNRLLAQILIQGQQAQINAAAQITQVAQTLAASANVQVQGDNVQSETANEPNKPANTGISTDKDNVQVILCAGQTKSGAPCQSKVQTPGAFCPAHKEKANDIAATA